MLIAGCVWLGAKERGAFGFSNEKSLMYCPSTLSCAWPCGALGLGPGLGAGPPLPPVVAIDSTSHYPQLPQSAAWLTQALGRTRISRAALGLTPAAPPWIGDLVPFAGLKLHNVSIARRMPGTARQRCEFCRDPPASRRQEQGSAQKVRYKTRKYKKDCPDHRCHAGRFQMQRSNPLLCEGGAQAVEIGAAEPSKQQHAHDGGGDEKTSRPQPADHCRYQEESEELRHGEHEQPD